MHLRGISNCNGSQGKQHIDLDFYSVFFPMGGGGGKRDSMDNWGGGGGEEHIRVQSMQQTRGSGGMLPREIFILDLLLETIWDCFHTSIIYIL